jgi:hypothetical protein
MASPTGDLEKASESTSVSDHQKSLADPDAEFGGTERRKILEKKLVRKIDLRMSILVLIYILNYIDRNNAGCARPPIHAEAPNSRHPPELPVYEGLKLTSGSTPKEPNSQPSSLSFMLVTSSCRSHRTCF